MMERTSARHARSRAFHPYECSECGYVAQVPVMQPAPTFCARCIYRQNRPPHQEPEA